MAEIAGLVIGGVALASLFYSSTNLVDRVNSGRAFESAHQDAALDIAMLSARLARWERTYRANPDPTATEEQREQAEAWLSRIKSRLQDAYELGVKYEHESERNDVAAGSSTAVEKSRVTEEVHDKLMVFHSKSTTREVTLADRTKWALRDEAKMDELVKKISSAITNIEKIFPSLKSAPARAAQQEADTIPPSEIQELAEALYTIEGAASKVDARLARTIREIETFDEAQVQVGDRYAPGYVKSGQQPRPSVVNIGSLKARGKSNVTIGDQHN